LQTFSVPAVPPAGWFVNVTSVSFAVDVPVKTVTLRPARSAWPTSRWDGRTETAATSVAGFDWASVIVT